MTKPQDAGSNFQSFPWNETEKSYIHSSYFWGYTLTSIPGGLIAKQYGTKNLLLSATLIASSLTMLSPIAVKVGGWKSFCAIRAIEGAASGVITPGVHTHISRWVPIKERNRLGIFCHMGLDFGTTLAYLVSSSIAANENLGWPGIFYITGFFGIILSCIWFFVGASTVDNSKLISSKERDYVKDTNGVQLASLSNSNRKENSIKRIPWAKILTSLPFLAYVITRITHSWGKHVLFTQMPTYMNTILGINIRENVLLIASPYIVMFFLSLIFILIAYILTKKTSLHLITIRKIFTTIGQGIPAISLIIFAFITEKYKLYAIGTLIVAVGSEAACGVGFVLNNIDLAPNYAGVLVAIANVLVNFVNILIPIVFGLIVHNEYDQFQWQVAFFIASGITFFGNIMFIIFGQVKPQAWNNL